LFFCQIDKNIIDIYARNHGGIAAMVPICQALSIKISLKIYQKRMAFGRKTTFSS